MTNGTARNDRSYGLTPLRSGGAWIKTNEVRYVYDARVVVQERDANNLPQVSYTRGNDLSGSAQGAGGIGGLLARTDHSTLNPQLSTAFYHCDGNGNITCLINASNAVVARYGYDPYGSMLAASGPLAQVNLYRFSSKELHPNSATVYYLYRYYEPNSQRWLNRDPIDEWGGVNLFRFSNGNPFRFVDLFGFAPGDKYPTCDAAAIQALKDIMSRSQDEDLEYSGIIYKTSDGTYSYGQPKAGGRRPDGGRWSLPPNKLPKPPVQAETVGGYHTHPTNTNKDDTSYDCVQCGFSTGEYADTWISDTYKLIGYLGTPYSEVKKYTPDPTQKGQGCVELIFSPYRDFPKVLKPGPSKPATPPPANPPAH